MNALVNLGLHSMAFRVFEYHVVESKYEFCANIESSQLQWLQHLKRMP